MMKTTRSAALLAVMLGGAVAFSGCASTPSTPEGIAEAKAKEAVAALQDGDQAANDALLCPSDSWGLVNVESFKDTGTKFTLDDSVKTSKNDSGLEVGGDVYDVQFLVENPPPGGSTRVAIINVKVTGDGAPCVLGEGTA